MSDQKCKLEKCKRPYRAKGYCTVHYREWRHGKFGKARFKSCHAEGCHKPMTRTGLCEQHAGQAAPPAAAPAEGVAAATEAKAPVPEAPPTPQT